MQCLQPRSTGPFKALGVSAIRDHDRNFSVQTSISDGIDDGLQVAAAAGNQNAESAIHQSSVTV
jgi:hypothetical protein